MYMGDIQRENIEKVRNMYYVERKTIKEIAETLHFTQSTVQEYINRGNKMLGTAQNKPKKTWKRSQENKPLTYKQIKAKSEKFQAEHGIRWGAGYIKLEPKPIEKVDLSKYDTRTFNNKKKKDKGSTRVMKNKNIDDLGEILKNKDVSALIEYGKKKGQDNISEEVVEIAMYKMIFARTDMPNELRKEAKKWLHDRGYNAAILMLPKKDESIYTDKES